MQYAEAQIISLLIGIMGNTDKPSFIIKPYRNYLLGFLLRWEVRLDICLPSLHDNISLPCNVVFVMDFALKISKTFPSMLCPLGLL